jgi:UDP-N-acetylmuramate dehydrogenase
VGFDIKKADPETYYVTVGAGENWDKVVARTVARGLHGIECLSLIPGTAGATPIQNVGAYGQEVSQTLVSVEAYDTKTGNFVTIPAEACDFAYRSSRFKGKDRGRFYIVSLTFCLTQENPQPPFYDALQRYIDQMKITDFTPKTIREIVIAIRSSRLPDPAKVANNGSFFGNPIISTTKYKALKKKFPDVKAWKNADGSYKIPAGWLLETAGYKGFHDLKTGMATWEHQALVLVNEKAETTADLLAFKGRIVRDIEHKFDITLEQEPELLP